MFCPARPRQVVFLTFETVLGVSPFTSIAYRHRSYTTRTSTKLTPVSTRGGNYAAFIRLSMYASRASREITMRLPIVMAGSSRFQIRLRTAHTVADKYSAAVLIVNIRGCTAVAIAMGGSVFLVRIESSEKNFRSHAGRSALRRSVPVDCSAGCSKSRKRTVRVPVAQSHLTTLYLSSPSTVNRKILLPITRPF